jgi:putative tryptophan/tyrosine transport system substrate-binding protein
MRRLIAAAIAAGVLLPSLPSAQEKVARVGWLTWREAGAYADLTHKGFVQGLREAGFVEGKNLVLLRRSAEGDNRRFPALARELAQQQLDVFFAPSTSMAYAARAASPKTPVVIATVADPIGHNFVKTLARPGTQVTGVTTLNDELAGKRLQLLAEMVPSLKRVGVLLDARLLESCSSEVTHLEEHANRLGISLFRFFITDAQELDAAFHRMKEQNVQAVTSTIVTSWHALEKEEPLLAARYGLPMVHDYEVSVRYGGLASYAPDYGDLFRRAGHYVGRILKGDRPADMALEEPRQFRLLVNLKTAKQRGLVLPQAVLVRADELIE